jgi:glutamine amidotransferase
MHNGQISGFDRIRRPMEAMLSDELFQARTGTTDSELLFLLALQFGLDADPIGAMEKAIAEVEQLSLDAMGEVLVRFTAAFSNGHELYAVRYATDHKPPTLFAAPMGGTGSERTGYCLVSEPLNDETDTWVEIPDGSAVKVADEGMQALLFQPRMLSRAA